MKRSTETISGSNQPLPSDRSPSPYGIHEWKEMAQALNHWVPERSPEAKAYFDGLWPAAEPYVSSLNTVFLLDLPELARRSEEQSWLVRDGLLPLIWFYTKNPAPGAFRGKLLVHADFEEYVPPAWRRQTELYEFISDGSEGYDRKLGAREEGARELYLLGLAKQSVCSLGQQEDDLKRIVERIGRDALAGMRIRAFVPPRFEAGWEGPETPYYSYYMQNLARYLGTEIEFVEFETLKWSFPERGAWVHDFNEKWLYAHSYLSLALMSKGCRPVVERIQGKAARDRAYDRVIPIFPRVSCAIRTKFRAPFLDYLSGSWVPESQDRAKAIYRAMLSPANRSYPWPKWFGSWCQDFSVYQSRGESEGQ